MMFAKTALLFVLTAIAEILGCYLPYLWAKEGKPSWFLIPAAFSLAVFSWLLLQHPGAASRTYAAYGGVYVAVAVLWLWIVENQKPTSWDFIGAGIIVFGMAVIVLAPKNGR